MSYAHVGPTLIPDWMHPDDAVLLTDVASTGYQAAEMDGIQVGEAVVVFGAGPIGIMAERCAWLFGAGRVIVIDRENYRLDFARRHCPAEVCNFKAMGDMAASIKKRPTRWGQMSALTRWAETPREMRCARSSASS